MTQKIHLLLAFLVLVFFVPVSAQDQFLNILEKEMNREFSELKKQEISPYYLCYRVNDKASVNIYGAFGCLVQFSESNNSQLTTQIRVGTPESDNFHEIKGANNSMALNSVSLPREPNEIAIRQAMWRMTNESYFQAIQKLTELKGNKAVNVANEDDSPDFTPGSAIQYYEPPMKMTIDKATEEKLKNKVRLYSKAFEQSKDITDGNVSLQVTNARDYFVSSEGSKIAENHPKINLSVSARVLAPDGMDLSLYKSYYMTDLKDLPKDEVVLTDIKALITKLEELKKAPVVDPYSGPALLSSEATGVFFHEIFGHRVESARMKSESDAQTFKNKVGQKVLNSDISVIFDPTISKYKDFTLSGGYQYDDEGVKSQKVQVVTDGILTGFLTSRTPIKGFSQSSGHGRAQPGYRPVSRQSNMIVESKKMYSEAELRSLFIEELKKQNLDFGFYFQRVSGGFTSTNRIMPNAFNVTPLEVYKVFSDGSPDVLVRGINLVGTPLAMFSEIEALGGDYAVFNGTCGAESGGIPVSAVCPMMFVKKIEIQKKQKSGNKGPILDRPF